MGTGNVSGGASSHYSHLIGIVNAVPDPYAELNKIDVDRFTGDIEDLKPNGLLLPDSEHQNGRWLMVGMGSSTSGPNAVINTVINHPFMWSNDPLEFSLGFGPRIIAGRGMHGIDYVAPNALDFVPLGKAASLSNLWFGNRAKLDFVIPDPLREAVSLLIEQQPDRYEDKDLERLTDPRLMADLSDRSLKRMEAALKALFVGALTSITSHDVMVTYPGSLSPYEKVNLDYISITQKQALIDKKVERFILRLLEHYLAGTKPKDKAQITVLVNSIDYQKPLFDPVNIAVLEKLRKLVSVKVGDSLSQNSIDLFKDLGVSLSGPDSKPDVAAFELRVDRFIIFAKGQKPDFSQLNLREE